MARLLHRLGARAHRHRLAVVLLWLLVTTGSVFAALAYAGDTTPGLSIPGQESTVALGKLQQAFGVGDAATAQVVVKVPHGADVTQPKYADAIVELSGQLGELPGVVSATNPLDPRNPTVNPPRLDTAFSTVTYDAKAGDVAPADQAALREAVADADAGPLTVAATGNALDEPPRVGGAVEGVGVLIALLVLAITYGTLIAAGMNLLTALIGVGIGALGITAVTGFVELNDVTPILATMLGLAVGIDYALFIVNRYRQELRSGADVHTAVAIAVGTAGSAVVTAGVTVVIALTGLAVAGIPFLTQMGLAAAATIVVAVLIAITLVPAVLSYLGRRVLPRKQRRVRTPRDPAVTVRQMGFLPGWIRLVVRHRMDSVLLSILVLGVLAAPVLSMQTTLLVNPPDGSTQQHAQRLIADGFGPGFNGPLAVLIERRDVQPAAAEAVERAKALGVAMVTEPTPNKAGTAAQFLVIPQSAPAAEETERLVADLRNEFFLISGAETYVTGPTAVAVDAAQVLDDALPVYLLLVVGLALVLLIIVFRSILVPVAGVLGFLLTIGAAFGASVAVFQWGWLDDVVNLHATGPLLSLAPIIVTGILFGLAMDYQVFLVSRMHEAHAAGDDPINAITSGFRQAAPVVVAAALIMTAVFAGFVPFGQPAVKTIAFALTVGIVIDAFIVRMVLVPAVLALLGKHAWWLPRCLLWLPAFDVDGGSAHRTPPVEPPAVPTQESRPGTQDSHGQRHYHYELAGAALAHMAEYPPGFQRLAAGITAYLDRCLDLPDAHEHLRRGGPSSAFVALVTSDLEHIGWYPAGPIATLLASAVTETALAEQAHGRPREDLRSAARLLAAGAPVRRAHERREPGPPVGQRLKPGRQP